MLSKSFTNLTVSDIQACPIWHFNNCDADELAIDPYLGRPCKTFSGIIVGTKLVLADGFRVWALLQNIDPHDPERNEHLLTVTVDKNGEWFSLARYHDVAFDEYGPSALATFLGRPVDQVFPFKFDIRTEVGFQAPGLSGTVYSEPRIRLSTSEIIEMVLAKSR